MLVANRPFSDKRQRRSGLYVSDDYLAVEIKGSLSTLVLRMKMRRAMIVEIHPNYYPKEYRDSRHLKVPSNFYHIGSDRYSNHSSASALSKAGSSLAHS
jgi:hypothetical protein